MSSPPVSAPADADVLIVGAGPAGLALACALGVAGLRIRLIEQQTLDALEAPADDGREIALTHRARRIMTELGMWARLPVESISPLRQARVLDGDSPTGLCLEASPGAGEQALGWLVPNHRIRRAAFEAAMACPGVQLEAGARVVSLARGAPLATVGLEDGRAWRAPLVVAADSRFSQTRRLAGIGASMRDFGRTVIVGPLAHALPHEGIALECFRYGNTLALLPMPGDQASAVVTVASDRAVEWLAMDDATFASRIEQQAQGRLGPMRALGPRHAYPLVAVYAHRFVADRFALVGDAAVGMHPVTAHGYNFGLYGVEALADALLGARRRQADPGSLAVLGAYERTHRRVTAPIYLGTNAIATLFTDDRPPARLLRQAVLSVAEHAPGISGLIKGAIRRQLTGAAQARANPFAQIGLPWASNKPSNSTELR